MLHLLTEMPRTEEVVWATARLILLSSGGGFALRGISEPRHHRCGIAVQDLRAGFVADLGEGLGSNLYLCGSEHQTTP
jgi:hypothetical protein